VRNRGKNAGQEGGGLSPQQWWEKGGEQNILNGEKEGTSFASNTCDWLGFAAEN